MEPLELVIKTKPEEPVAFACATCGAMFSCLSFGGGGEKGALAAKQAAEGHCGPKFCPCGAVIERKHWLACDVCLEKKEQEKERARFEKAKKVTIDEYDAELAVFWEDGPRGSIGDGFYVNLDELLELCEDEQLDLPEYVWSTKPLGLEMSASAILEHAMGNHHEDAWDELSEDAESKLQKALNDFCATQKLRSWLPNYEVAVVLRPSE